MEQYCSIPLTYTDPLSDHYWSAQRPLLLHTSSNCTHRLRGKTSVT